MITLQQQIDLLEGRQGVARCKDNPIDEAILASLRRLQEIEAQEPVAFVNLETLSKKSNAVASSFRATVNQATLYAMPVSPEGYKLVPIEPTFEMCKAGGFDWEGWGSSPFPVRYKAMLAAVDK